MTVGRRHAFTLDDASLSGGTGIISAGSGLPRRIERAPTLAHVLALSPVACWAFNGDWLDSGSSGYGLTALSGATLVSGGKEGGCAQSGGSGMAQRLARSAAFEPEYNAQFSVSLWWYGAEPAAGCDLINNFAAPTTYAGWGLMFEGPSSVSLWFIRDSGSNFYKKLTAAGVGSLFTASTWHHVVGAFNFWPSQEHKLYIDGVERAGAMTGNGVALTPSYSQPIFLGNRAAGGAPAPSQSKIDLVSYFNRTLSAAEVKALYYGGLADAKWTLPADVSQARTLTGLLLPGATVREKTASGVLTFAKVGAGAETPIEGGALLGVTVPAGSPVTLRAEFQSGADPYIADSLGGGPVALWDEADPATPGVLVPGSELSAELDDLTELRATIEDRSELMAVLEDRDP